MKHVAASVESPKQLPFDKGLHANDALCRVELVHCKVDIAEPHDRDNLLVPLHGPLLIQNGLSDAVFLVDLRINWSVFAAAVADAKHNEKYQ